MCASGVAQEALRQPPVCSELRLFSREAISLIDNRPTLNERNGDLSLIEQIVFVLPTAPQLPGTPFLANQ